MKSFCMKKSVPYLTCILTCILALLLVFTGCNGLGSSDAGAGSSSANANEIPRVDMYDMAAQMSPPMMSYETSGALAGADTLGRKVIFSASYQLETTQMSVTLAALELAVHYSGGFIQSSDYSGRVNSDQYQFASIVCRIPITSVNAFKAAIETAGNVTAKTESGQDVTDEYFDVEGRLTVLRAEEARLLELLAKTGTVSELLEVERELTRVRTGIESLTGTLKRYNDLIDLATFYLSVWNVDEYSPSDDETFIEQLGRAVTGSLDTALTVLQTLVIVLVYILPYLVVAGLVVFFIIWINRRRRKARLAKQEAMFALYGKPNQSLGSTQFPPPQGDPSFLSVQQGGSKPVSQQDGDLLDE